MSTKTLLMFATTSLLTPVALEGAADAGGRTQTAVIIPRAVQDTAPIANGRLRRTNEEQPGNEMSTFALTDDKKSGFYFSMTTELPPLTAGGPVRRATDRIQLSKVPFVLEQTADGSVTAKATGPGEFVTSNDGNEYRNANHPHAFSLPGANTMCAEYNYQDNNSNDTKRYIQCFNATTGLKTLDQGQPIFAKNNDDAAMGQAGRMLSVTQKIGNKFQIVAWRGANGNGRDDGWLQSYNLTVDAAGSVKFANEFDVSLCPREERSHGFCSVAAADPNTAVCTWTEGNTQPQRDGSWMAAVDITPGKFSGADRQQSILWKEQIDGRKDINGLRTYSMRASHERILKPDATGTLVPSDELLFYSNDLRGNNNENRKGGTVYAINMGVIKADRAGMSYVQPLTDMAAGLRGLGGTHLGMTLGMFGSADSLKPGVIFVNGSHTGGYFSGQARTMTFDAATASFKDGGMTATAPNDRHLYPNYLGNNPGNQGRNYSHSQMFENPFVGLNGNTDKYLMIHATTGKPMEEVGMPEYKATAFLTVSPIASACNSSTGAGNGTGGGGGMGGGNVPGCQNNGGTDPGTDPSTDPVTPEGEDPSAADPGASLGGCSSTGGSAGLASMLLIGLAAFLRRRRA